MPQGTYQFKPKNNNALKLSDCEEFIFNFLKDICSESNNPLLQTAIINYGNDANLSDLNNANEDIQLLIAFWFNNEDQRNINLTAKTNDDGTSLKVVYEIGVVALKDKLTSITFLTAVEEIIDGMTNNWNGESGTPTPYTLTLINGKILTTNTTTNTTDNFPTITIAQEDINQPNYLTALINIVFVISNNT
jgi:hypothetical protein